MYHAQMQTAVVSLLNSAAGVQGIFNGRIYDEVCATDAGQVLPGGAAPGWPYIQIGDCTFTARTVKRGLIGDYTLDVHVWSRAGGQMEAKRALAVVSAALNDQLVTLDVSRRLAVEYSDVSVDQVSPVMIYHGVIRVGTTT